MKRCERTIKLNLMNSECRILKNFLKDYLHKSSNFLPSGIPKSPLSLSLVINCMISFMINTKKYHIIQIN